MGRAVREEGVKETARPGGTMNQAIGKPFPDIELPDHEGQRVRLSQIAGKFPLILVFYRGYW